MSLPKETINFQNVISIRDCRDKFSTELTCHRMTLYLRTPISLRGALPGASFSTDRFAFLYIENTKISLPPQSRFLPEIRFLEYIAHVNNV
jgi:hypothetical protein